MNERRAAEVKGNGQYLTSSKLGPTAASANESLSTFHHHDIDIPAIHLRHFALHLHHAPPTISLGLAIFIDGLLGKNNTHSDARGMRHATQ